MFIRLPSLIFAALLPAAIAQETGSAEGRVTSSTDHAGIAGATVTVESWRTTTDSSGAFRFAVLKLGDHEFSAEAAGFFQSKSKLRVDSTLTAAHFDIELIPHASISGRVFDDEGKPIAGVPVEITEAVRGTGTTSSVWIATTHEDGRYDSDAMRAGTYLAMVRPNPLVIGFTPARPPRWRQVPAPRARDGKRRTWVRTYYPAVSDRNDAGRLVLRPGTRLSGVDIRLLAVPVYAIRGTIYDDAGKPVNATVTLAPPETMMELPEATVQAPEGAFEFPDVPAGDWRLIAEADLGGTKLRGSGSEFVSRHDLDDVAIRLAAPFALQGFVEPHAVGECVQVELYPTDAPASGGAAYSKADSDGTLRFRAVYPGRYTVNVYAHTPDHYLESIRIGEHDILGQEVLLAEGMPPVHIVFKRNSAALRGSVENCGSASILVLPQDEGLWNERFIRRGSCDDSGHFEIGALRPGDYYALALERIISTGLDDLPTLRQLASMGTKVTIESGRVAYVELKRAPWPD